jgi:hypothetical protein
MLAGGLGKRRGGPDDRPYPRTSVARKFGVCEQDQECCPEHRPEQVNNRGRYCVKAGEKAPLGEVDASAMRFAERGRFSPGEPHIRFGLVRLLHSG